MADKPDRTDKLEKEATFCKYIFVKIVNGCSDVSYLTFEPGWFKYQWIVKVLFIICSKQILVVDILINLSPENMARVPL